MGGRFDAIAQFGEERGLGSVDMDKAKAGLGFFERYLSLWVALCILVGIGLGALMPGPFRLLGEANLAKVNLPVAVLIWLMIIPMLLRVDFGAIAEVGKHWRGLAGEAFQHGAAGVVLHRLAVPSMAAGSAD